MSFLRRSATAKKSASIRLRPPFVQRDQDNAAPLGRKTAHRRVIEKHKKRRQQACYASAATGYTGNASTNV